MQEIEMKSEQFERSELWQEEEEEEEEEEDE